MVDCDFSEFSYGYACTKEAEAYLEIAFARAGAPVLPSLRAERESGYDVQINTRIGYALHMQFKRPTYVTRRHPDSPTWDWVGSAHYRASIDAGCHQHSALTDLAGNLSNGGDVLYAFPSFHERTSFDNHYRAGTVLQHSTMFPPGDFLPGTGLHYYTVEAMTGTPRMFSEPTLPEIEPTWERVTSSASRIAHERSQEEQEGRRRAGIMTLGDLEEYFNQAVSTLGVSPPERRPQDYPISRVRDLAAQLGGGLALLLEGEA